MDDAVYVMYMGGPDSIEAVEPFLYNLFTDREIIDFKIGNFLQSKIASIIAKKRSKKVAPDYLKMGGGSPQLPIAKKLFNKVSKIYSKQTGRELQVFFGMCYYNPYIEDTYREMQKGDFERITVMTLYPQYSYTTSGVCFGRFLNVFKHEPLRSKFSVIPFWHMNEGYNLCIIENIRQTAQKNGINVQDCTLMFSAHSLPEYTVAKGDIYVSHIHSQIEYIVSKLQPFKHILCYQSKAGLMRWLGPSTDKTLYSLKDEKRPVIVVPISFVSDHIETLIELDEMYIKKANLMGMNVLRMESLNDSDDFACAMANIVSAGATC